MALNLDTRQRAMLQEMGITVWSPAPAAAPTAPMAVNAAVPVPAEVSTAAVHVATSATVAPAPAPVPARSAPATMPTAAETLAAPVSTTPAPVRLAPVASTPVAAPTPPTAIDHQIAAEDWLMAPPVQVFTEATAGDAQDAWLVLWEGPHPLQPFTSESGQLLRNMLRALGLHQHCHVWVASVQRPNHQALPVAGLATANVDWQPLQTALRQHMQATPPARMLIMGLHAARAALGSTEPLGRLRAQVHRVQGCPAVVTYDPAYLLRVPRDKAGAWHDLCRAHALRPPAQP